MQEGVGTGGDPAQQIWSEKMHIWPNGGPKSAFLPFCRGIGTSSEELLEEVGGHGWCEEMRAFFVNFRFLTA